MTSLDQVAAATRTLAKEVDSLGAVVQALAQDRTADTQAIAEAQQSAAAAHRAVLTLTEAVTGIADQVRALTDTVTGTHQQAPKSPRPYWLTITDPDLAASLLAGLTDWVAAVYLRFPNSDITDCWTFHEAVVAELHALWAAWSEALDPERGSAARVVDWHDRYRPAVMQRVDRELRECALREHRAGEPRSYRPARVPGTHLADQVARWWATTHGSTSAPEPTADMFAEEKARIHANRSARY